MRIDGSSPDASKLATVLTVQPKISATSARVNNFFTA
jgi:hypothetical protein